MREFVVVAATTWTCVILGARRGRPALVDGVRNTNGSTDGGGSRQLSAYALQRHVSTEIAKCCRTMDFWQCRCYSTFCSGMVVGFVWPRKQAALSLLIASVLFSSLPQIRIRPVSVTKSSTTVARVDNDEPSDKAVADAVNAANAKEAKNLADGGTTSAGGSAASTMMVTISPTVVQVVRVMHASDRFAQLIRLIEELRTMEREQGQRHPGPMLVFCNTVDSVKVSACLLLFVLIVFCGR